MLVASLMDTLHWRFMCALTDLYVSVAMQGKRQRSLGSMLLEPLHTVICMMCITVGRGSEIMLPNDCWRFTCISEET